MELKDTVAMMNSEDFKERLRAEYFQAEIRYNKLDEMIDKCKDDNLAEFAPIHLIMLKEQKKIMGGYLTCLRIRSEIEGIDLKEEK